MTDEHAMITASKAMPAMNIQEATQRYRQLCQFVSELMDDGKDYGTIPGTDKKTLLKAGAEKLTTYFGLTPIFVDETIVEDWSDREMPFFFYRRKCQLWRAGILIGEGSGSCNSREKKYRWREASRKCPHCISEAIIKGKEEFGGGWICWTKKGGCGAKFQDDDPAITDQQVGQVENPDIYDLANTILKMADKRALVAATLITVNASEFFTQDLEDLEDTVEVKAQIKNPAPKARKPKASNGKTKTGFRVDFLNEYKMTERDALACLGTDTINDWLKANPGKTLTDAETEVLAVSGKIKEAA